MIKNTLLACLLFVFGVAANGESLDVDLGAEMVRGQLNVLDRRQPLGFSGSVMLVEDVADVYSLNLRTQGLLDVQKSIRGGFGGRFYYVSPEVSGFDDFQSLGLGGYVDFKVPELRGVIVGAEVYFAPSVTTSGDYDSLREIAFKIRYHIYQNSDIYLGLRYIDASGNGGRDFEIDENPQIGFTLRF